MYHWLPPNKPQALAHAVEPPAQFGSGSQNTHVTGICFECQHSDDATADREVQVVPGSPGHEQQEVEVPATMLNVSP